VSDRHQTKRRFSQTLAPGHPARFGARDFLVEEGELYARKASSPIKITRRDVQTCAAALHQMLGFYGVGTHRACQIRI
jgi:hypothetical protein